MNRAGKQIGGKSKKEMQSRLHRWPGMVEKTTPSVAHTPDSATMMGEGSTAAASTHHRVEYTKAPWKSRCPPASPRLQSPGSKGALGLRVRRLLTAVLQPCHQP